jgi:MurNAc alpha-1-phosphate uridylyltransferase
MMPLTRKLPKPLVPVLGKPVLGWIVEHLARAGLSPAIVNAHHLAGHIEAFCRNTTTIPLHVSREDAILETGGGVARALSLLTKDKPFVVINGDSLWLDGATPALSRLFSLWNDNTMDALLLLYPSVLVPDWQGKGDFLVSPEGQLQRPGEGRQAAHIFMGVQLLHPRLFNNHPDGAFSLNMLYNKAAGQGRLFGAVHDGLWFHLSRPEDISKAEFVLKRL